MSNNSASISCLQFLKHILPAEGYYCWWYKAGKIPCQGFTTSIEELHAQLLKIDAECHNAYFACAVYKTTDSREAINARGAKIFWLDLDAGPGKPYADADAAVDALDAFCVKIGLPRAMIIYSGNGIHAYWVLDRLIDPDVWVNTAKSFKRLTKQHSLHADPTRTADIASILRPTGTHNWKRPDDPQLVACEEFQDIISADDFLRIINQAQPTPPNNGTNASDIVKDVTAIYEPSYAAIAANECAQLHRMRDTHGNIPEPEWYAGLCVLVSCADGEALYQDWSSGYDKYDPAETKAKFDHALADSPGPTKCERFQELNPAGCEGCPHIGKITSPIQLGRKQTQQTFPPEIATRIDELAALPLYEYEIRRDKEADKLGVRVTMLDKFVQAARPQDVEDKKNGRPLSLPLPEPWNEAVDGATLLDEIVAELKHYAVLGAGVPETIALWIMHAHVFHAFTHTPRLFLSSPVKRCGKSTVLLIIKCLVPKHLLADNITAAALFRTVELARPTLLIDEADSFAKDNEELRGIINSGYMKDGNVVRLVGDDYEPRAFSTWCPLVLAAIGNLPGTIEDRSIIIAMRRRKMEERTKRFKPKDNARLDILCRRAARWAIDNINRLTDADPMIPEALNDRAMDNWRPLLTIADAVGGAWAERARQAALTLSGEEAQEDRSIQIKLLADIRVLFAGAKLDKIPSAELCARLAMLEGAPWAEWYKGRPMNQAQLARQLDGFNIKPKDIRHSDGRNLKGYERDQFEDVFSRYLP